MAWLDTVLLSTLPLLIVMSILALAMPALRPRRVWAGLALAWVVVFAAGLLIAATSPEGWSLDCNVSFGRINITTVSDTGLDRACSGANHLSLWLVALPPTLGIGVLLAWVLRTTAPAADALRMAATLTALSIVTVGIAQINGNAALLLVVALAALNYAWPRIRRQWGAPQPKPATPREP
jgi:hypothetical protein